MGGFILTKARCISGWFLITFLFNGMKPCLLDDLMEELQEILVDDLGND